MNISGEHYPFLAFEAQKNILLNQTKIEVSFHTPPPIPSNNNNNLWVFEIKDTSCASSNVSLKFKSPSQIEGNKIFKHQYSSDYKYHVIYGDTEGDCSDRSYYAIYYYDPQKDNPAILEPIHEREEDDAIVEACFMKHSKTLLMNCKKNNIASKMLVVTGSFSQTLDNQCYLYVGDSYFISVTVDRTTDLTFLSQSS